MFIVVKVEWGTQFSGDVLTLKNMEIILIAVH
jgi:hypothetical protein